MKNLLKIALTLLIGIVMSVGIFRPDMLMGTPASPAVGNWYQQFLPNLGGRQIVDITFTDSLNGHAITTRLSATDTTFIIKTTDKGDSWFVSFHDSGVVYTSMQFINQNTGFVGGYIYKGGLFKIVKTTNAGVNWFYINAPFDVPVSDLYSLNEDTIWLASSSLFSGGVFFTSNGGTNWQVQYQGNNPGHIYMYDRNLGFISPPTLGALYRTTNSGVNWVQVPGTDGFNDIKFVDSQTGWKASGFMRKTTNGGLNWVQQTIPTGGIITGSSIRDIHLLDIDTIWGVGGSVQYPNLQSRGVIYRTINGGDNWLFQIPDTSINLYYYSFIQFVNSNSGWSYRVDGGIHTTTGGDPIWLTAIEQLSTETPISYKLNQNYPNPFNPVTTIRFEISKQSLTELKIFDITGKQIQVLLKEELLPGVFEVKFDASDLTSGVYFYKLTVTTAKEVFNETKKMILLK